MNTEVDEKISQYYALYPRSFPVVKSFSLTQAVNRSTGAMEQTLAIVFAKDHGFSGDMLYMDLHDVRDLKVNQPWSSLITLSNIQIAPASANGAGGHRFLVYDAEMEEVFACSCRDFCVAVG